MEEIKEGDRNQEANRNKHPENLDILQIVNYIEGERRKAEGSLRVPGEQPCTIYQVSKVLRQLNEKCYEPQLVSIGPYHRGKKGLKPMEEKKSQYLLALLSRYPKLKLEDFVMEIKKLEAKARKCYSESISLKSKEFVKMMVFDGCFLVEIFIRIHTTKNNDELWLPLFISHDMLLLENQLPFFVLESIFSLVVPIKKAGSLKDLFLECFELLYVLPLNEDAATKETYHHLLDIFHHHCLPTHRMERNCADLHIQAHSDPDPDPDPDRNAALLEADADIEAQNNANQGPNSEHNSHNNPNADPPSIIERRSHAEPNFNAQLSGLVLVLPLVQILIRRKLRKLAAKMKILAATPFSIRSAEELEEAGVKFKRKVVEPAGSFLDVEFDKRGIMKIPSLYFYEGLQTIFQNLIAYEQCCPKAGTFFTGYALFMDHLINTAKDVRILRHAGIIEHGLGSDDELARHFNELCRRILYQVGTIHLSSERRAINDYCRKKWPTWRAKLMHNYFNSPWAILSLIAAVLLLLLTITQTVFSIIPNA